MCCSHCFSSFLHCVALCCSKSFSIILYVNVCTGVYKFVSVYECVHVCMHMCVCACVCIELQQYVLIFASDVYHDRPYNVHAYVHVYTQACIKHIHTICMHLCLYVSPYITYIHTQTIHWYNLLHCFKAVSMCRYEVKLYQCNMYHDIST